MKINWSIFFDNTSSVEALYEFTYCKSSIDILYNDCWMKECKTEVSKMKKLGVVKSRKNAKRALARRTI